MFMVVLAAVLLALCPQIVALIGTPAEAILPAVLRHVDGILVVSAMGATGSEALSALIAEIAPWRDKLVGNILIGDRAA